RAAGEVDPGRELGSLNQQLQVGLRGLVVELHAPAPEAGLDGGVRLRADHHANGAQVGVAAHVVKVVGEPARHHQRLGAHRVEPGLEDELVLSRWAVAVGDLYPVERVELLLEFGGQRRADVEGEARAREISPEIAALEEQARREGAAGDDHRLGGDPEGAPVRERAANFARPLATRLDRFGEALAEDPYRAGEVPLGPGQDVVERRELLAVGTPDVAIAGAEAVLDVGVDHAAPTVKAELLDALGHLRAALLEVLVVLLAVDGEPLAQLIERPQETVLLDAGVEPIRVVPALESVRWDVVTDGVVDDGAAADALSLQDLEAGVRRHLQPAVVQEIRELHALVLAEVPRIDVLAALQQDDLPACLGQPVGEHRAGGAAADDRHVGGDALGVDLVRLAHVEGGELADPLDDLLVTLALGERDVAGRGGRARIGVVADDHH